MDAELRLAERTGSMFTTLRFEDRRPRNEGGVDAVFVEHKGKKLWIRPRQGGGFTIETDGADTELWVRGRGTNSVDLEVE